MARIICLRCYKFIARIDSAIWRHNYFFHCFNASDTSSGHESLPICILFHPVAPASSLSLPPIALSPADILTTIPPVLLVSAYICFILEVCATSQRLHLPSVSDIFSPIPYKSKMRRAIPEANSSWVVLYVAVVYCWTVPACVIFSERVKNWI